MISNFKTATTSPSTKANNILKIGLFITVLLYNNTIQIPLSSHLFLSDPDFE